MSKESKNKEKKVKTSKPSKGKSNFMKDTKAELKKVIWPNSKQLFNNTLAVITIVIIIGLIVFVLDVCFDKINSYGIDKLKAAVQTENTVSEESSEADTEESSEITSEDTDISVEETTTEEQSTESEETETQEQ